LNNFFLFFQLSAESSGDAEDYLEKLRDAEMMIQRMKERNMTSMKEMAEDELEKATDCKFTLFCH